MYRNKILVIFSLMIIGLLCVIIWSSNVVADHEAQKAEENAEPIQIGVPIQHREDAGPEEEEEPAQETEEETPPYVVNTDIIMPLIKPDYKRIKVVESNYTKSALAVTPLILWNPSSFPLKVYLKDASNYPERYEDGIKSGFNNWSSVTDNLVSFEFIDNSNDANVIVNVTEKAENCENASCPSEYRLETAGRKLLKAHVNIPKVNCAGEELKPNEVYARVQHDVGHILGIGVHPEDVSSVMYPNLTYNNTNITSVDASTLKYLYMYIPEITDVPLKQFNKEKMLVKDEAVKMSDKEFYDYMLNHLPDKSLTEFDKLVNGSYELYLQQNYKKAVEELGKALKLTSDKFEQSYAHSLLSVCYLELGNNDEAHSSALQAYNVLPNVSTHYFLDYVKYKCKRYNEAEAQLETLIHDAPTSARAYALLALTYIEQGKWGRLQEFSKEVAKQFPNDPPFVLNYVPTEDNTSSEE